MPIHRATLALCPRRNHNELLAAAASTPPKFSPAWAAQRRLIANRNATDMTTHVVWVACPATCAYSRYTQLCPAAIVDNGCVRPQGNGLITTLGSQVYSSTFMGHLMHSLL